MPIFYGQIFWLFLHFEASFYLQNYNEPLANKDLANTDFSKTLTRSDEKSCTKNLANTDLANTDIFKIVIESDENHNYVSFHSINTVTMHKDEIFFIQRKLYEKLNNLERVHPIFFFKK